LPKGWAETEAKLMGIQWSYPKAWDVDFHTRPSRAKQNQWLRLVARGVEDDGNWPDYRKPHIYYW
jgi:hypothetical protein